MKCSRGTGLDCPRVDCLGLADPGACDFHARLNRHRLGLPPGEIRRPRPGPRPRVGLWAANMNGGGAETWGRALLRATAARFDWQGVAVDSNESFANAEALAATRRLAPVEFGPGAARRLAGRCDVVIGWPLRDVEPDLAGIIPRPGLIQVDHFPHDAPLDPASRWCLRSANRMVAVSTLCLPGYSGWWERPLRVIGNAIDPERLKPTRTPAEVRRAWGVPQDCKIVGFYSRIARCKRPDALLRAVASLPADWRGIIVGDARYNAPELAALEGLIRAEPGLAGRVGIHPPDDRAADVIGAVDALLVPAEEESWGYSIAEAVLLGRAVITTGRGLAALDPGLTRVVPLDADGPTLARAILDEFHAPPDRRAARDRLSRDVDLARFGRRWGRVVDELCAEVTGTPDAARAWAAIETCPHAEGGCGCPGGEPRTCKKGRAPVTVTRDECRECFGKG